MRERAQRLAVADVVARTEIAHARVAVLGIDDLEFLVEVLGEQRVALRREHRLDLAQPRAIIGDGDDTRAIGV